MSDSLRPLPDLGQHEIVAAQLATNGMEGDTSLYRSDHLGRVVAFRVDGCLLAGELTAVTDSVTAPMLILTIGKHQKAFVHPSHRITVAPEGHRLTVTAEPA